MGAVARILSEAKCSLYRTCARQIVGIGLTVLAGINCCKCLIIPSNSDSRCGCAGETAFLHQYARQLSGIWGSPAASRSLKHPCWSFLFTVCDPRGLQSRRLHGQAVQRRRSQDRCVMPARCESPVDLTQTGLLYERADHQLFRRRLVLFADEGACRRARRCLQGL